MFTRRSLQTLLFIGLILMSVHAATAQEVWVARGGTTTLHVNADLMRDLGIRVAGVQDTVASPPGMELRMEDPYWTFAISQDSDLRFQVNNGIAVPYGVLDGALHHAGSIMWQVGTAIEPIENFRIGYVPAIVQGPGGPHPSDVLYFGSSGDISPVMCKIENSMLDFRKSEGALYIHYMNFSISPGLGRQRGSGPTSPAGRSRWPRRSCTPRRSRGPRSAIRSSPTSWESWTSASATSRTSPRSRTTGPTRRHRGDLHGDDRLQLRRHRCPLARADGGGPSHDRDGAVPGDGRAARADRHLMDEAWVLRPLQQRLLDLPASLPTGASWASAAPTPTAL